MKTYTAVDVVFKNVSHNHFTYSVPPLLHNKIHRGQRVWTSFRKKHKIGIIIDIKQVHTISKLLPIDAIVDTRPLFSRELWKTLNWIRRYYCSSWSDVLSHAVPQFFMVSPLNDTSTNIKNKTLPFQGIGIQESQLEWNWAKSSPTEVYKKISNDSDRLFSWEKTIKKLQNVTLPINENNLMIYGIKKAELNVLQKKGWIVSRTIKKTVIKSPQEAFHQELPKLSEQYEYLYHLLKKQWNHTISKRYIYNSPWSWDRIHLYLHIVYSAMQSQKRLLILFPEYSIAKQVYDYMAKYTSHIIFSHRTASQGQIKKTWHKILYEGYHWVIGTPSQIFLPLAFDMIIMDESASPSYKEKKTPYYHTRDIVIMRSKYEKTTHFFIDITLDAKTAVLKPTTSKFGFHYPSHSRTVILDSRQYKSQPYLPIPLQSAIKNAYNEQKKILIIASHKGYCSYYQCNRCKTIIECPFCYTPMKYLHSRKIFSCIHCSYIAEYDIHTTTKGCDIKALSPKGFIGIAQWLEIWQKLFPKIPINSIYSSMPKKQWDNTLDYFNTHQNAVLIATSAILKPNLIQNIDVIVMLNVDAVLNSSSLFQEETLFRQIMLMRHILKDNKKSTLYITTHHPHLPVFKYALKNNIKSFWAYELKNRKHANYTPYSRCIKIQFSKTSLHILEKSAFFFYQQMCKYFDEDQILGPNRNYQNQQNTWEIYVLISWKTSLDETNSTLDTIKNEFKKSKIAGKSKVAIHIECDPLS